MPKSKKKSKKKNNSFGIRKEKERKRLHEIRQSQLDYRRSLERDNKIKSGSALKEILSLAEKLKRYSQN